MSLSPMYDTTWRWLCTPPLRALVMSFSAMGRRALALASVVTMPSAANSDAAMLANISRWWEAEPPKRRPFLGVAGMALHPALGPQREAALVELLEDLVEGLLAEVGDGQQVLLGLVDQFAHGIDLGPLEAVAGTLGEVELLDGQVEVGRAAAQHADVAQLQSPGSVAHLGHQGDEGAQGGAGGGQGLAGRDGAVGLDVEGQLVVVGGLLDP